MRTIPGMTVAITGASAGIGAALARVLHHRGARLVLAARRVDRLEQLNRELGGGHRVIACDVADPADCQRFIAQALAGGPIDTLVLNAGIGLAKSIAETSEAEWEHLLRVNLIGTTACIRASLPALRAQPERDGWRAQVMIVGSALSRRGAPQGGAYSATKAAQLSVAEALRVEERPHRIAVTSVHPISTDTEFFTATTARSGQQAMPRAPVIQSADHVARRMAGAIARPRPELWPHRPSRWVFILGAIWPGGMDRYFLRRG